VRGYVVDVNFCVFDVSVEEFGAGLGLGFGLGFRIGIGFRLGIVLVDVLTKNGRIQIAKDIKKSGMITSAIQQIVNTDRTELKDFLNEVDKLHKTDEAVTAMSAIWILPLPRVARTLVLELCLLLV
jgi:uncharacterized protein YebE (UPF0316 family)